jgi:hypothetical protein
MILGVGQSRLGGGGVRVPTGLQLIADSPGKQRKSSRGEPKGERSCVTAAQWAKLPAVIKAFVAALIQSASGQKGGR